MSKKQHIPALRFPGFEGEWEIKQLKDICFVNQGLQIPIADRLSTPSINSRKYITIQFLNNNKSVEYIDKYTESVCCNIEDVLMTRTGNTGIVVSGVEGVFHNNFFKINFDRNQLHHKFLISFLTLSRTQQIILTKAGASTIPDLNHKDFYSIYILFPSLPEQQKIASFLSAVDEKLLALKKKKELLRQYKKGVMQQIFSQELRFKDANGEEFEEWEEKSLRDIATEVKGNGNIDSQYLDVLTISSERGFVSQIEKFSQVIAGNSLEKYTMLSQGQMSYNKGASKRFRYGCFYVLESFERALVPNVYISFKFSNSVVPKFYEYLFSTKYADSQLRGLISSSARLDGLLNINKQDFFSLIIPVPSLPEQQKIAAFLSALDDKINLVQSQIEKTEAWKKGLLQQLFV